MDALSAVELQDYANRPTNTLSGGQKQRVAIAGALAQNPKVRSQHSLVSAFALGTRVLHH